MPAVLNFKDIDREDIELVGGKGANLGEMTRAGFPVPAGFCVTAQTYKRIIEYNDLDGEIRKILEPLDVHDSRKLKKAAGKVKRLIEKADVPSDIVKEIIAAYESLKKGERHPLVAVRSSATAEDLPDASFAGQQATFLNVEGEAELMQSVRKAWASLFEPRAIFYRENKGFDHFKVALAVPVQLMVQSETSGIMFTINPINNDKRRVVIEAVWGLGEMAVQGKYTPDRYQVDKTSKQLYSLVVNRQEEQLIRQGKDTKEVAVPEEKIEEQKLDEKQIVELAEIGVKLQDHYKFPQDVEWAEEDGELFIVQTRPITTMDKANEAKNMKVVGINKLEEVLEGIPAAPGTAWGEPKIIKSANDLNKIKEGDVLVTEMTTPDFVPGMKRAVAIVTDKGGQTSHAAIVSRELGLPAVVGTDKASKALGDYKLITVNGSTGKIYKDKPELKKKQSSVVKKIKPEEAIETATKVYVNLGEPELAGRVAGRDVDGVGLLRAEFMMAQIGMHPKKIIEDGKQEEFIEELTDGLERFGKAFGYRPVVYRASDFKTNEYRNLTGGKNYEPEEENPMLGYRGASRYITDEKVFEMELEAINRVRDKREVNNIWLMIPFVRTPEQMMKVKRIVAASGLRRSPSFKLWMMVEVPTNIIMLEEFAKAGIDGISIGSNDLTMLTLGVDRDNENVANLYDERDPSVLWMIETAIKKAHDLDLTVSICGQAPSVYSELTENLVKWGVTSVSVSPDAIERTREIVYECEKRLVK